MNNGIDIADAIEALREDLTVAMYKGRYQRMRFRLDPVVVELRAVVATGGEGKVGWKVLEVGGARSREATHTVTLKLIPEWREADETYTTDFRVSGELPLTPKGREHVLSTEKHDAVPHASTRHSKIDEGVEDD